ncbi:MAG: hypothetical protein JWP26_3138 [Devosia sp.]|nr:hypothetical protein [Devosia sp.]MDB5588168.1 hypothetical protein [Devosia sp.]
MVADNVAEAALVPSLAKQIDNINALLSEVSDVLGRTQAWRVR